MKKKIFLWLNVSMIVVASAATIIACNKKFDAPPAPSDPNITPSNTIAELKAIHATSGAYDVIDQDITVAGIVVANDSSGNFYKQLFIQDASGGLQILIDAYSLYTSFPIGRKVYLKCKGLCISDDHGMMEIGVKTSSGGVTQLSGIPSPLMSNYVIGGSLNNPVTPIPVALTDLTTNMQDKYLGSLVQLENFEVAPADTSKTWADTSVNKNSININVQGCGGAGKTIIRTSGYANFAGLKVPSGNGMLRAIYTVYTSTKQFIIRDTTDAAFYNARCGSNAQTISLQQLRAMYTGSNVTLGEYIIHGTVISDASNGNIGKGNAVIQDGNSGIIVYFGSTTITYNVGDSVVLNATGLTLKKYNGSLELDAYGTTPPAPVATGKTVTPNVTTIKTLSDNLSTMEFTLVQIKSATASGGATYSGNKTITDASGSMTLYTSSYATFKDDALPSGAHDWVGYGNFYNSTKELQIRNTNDVTGGGTGGGSGTIFSENFYFTYLW